MTVNSTVPTTPINNAYQGGLFTLRNHIDLQKDSVLNREGLGEGRDEAEVGSLQLPLNLALGIKFAWRHPGCPAKQPDEILCVHPDSGGYLLG
jgi:hypothetical protein